MSRKAPVTGIVAYVSRRGTEIRLLGDPKRYRGTKLHGARIPTDPKCKTANVFRHVEVGDTVRLIWGGFAYMNIALCVVLKKSSTPFPPKKPYTPAEQEYRSRPNFMTKLEVARLRKEERAHA